MRQLGNQKCKNQKSAYTAVLLLFIEFDHQYNLSFVD